MEPELLLVLIRIFEELQQFYRRRRHLYLRLRDNHVQTRPLYCRITLSVPVLDCFFNRFRAIFLQSLEVHHTFVPHVITACAILHNICLGAGDVMAPEDDPEEAVEEDECEVGTEAVSSAVWQDQLSPEVSALEEVPPEHDYY
ncbi:hypothetical protein ILYODFUR_028620 [Ilyodon furcidens]|uniref:Nuclease HARBI1 n=1 Tax=Ilyodon furcidens TaxID=33524 RepID=A0ABV0UX33_9TELE